MKQAKNFLNFFLLNILLLKTDVFFNIYQHIVQSLYNAGIAQIIDTKFNTFSQPDDFFSYRRDKNTGRMSTFVGILS